MVKQTILKILKEGRKSTAEISGRIKRNFYDTTSFLQELRLDKKVKMIIDNKFTYWEVKK